MDFYCTRPRSYGTEKHSYLREGRAPGRARWHRCRRKAPCLQMRFPCFAGKMVFGARTGLLFGVSSARRDQIRVLQWRGFFFFFLPPENRGEEWGPRGNLSPPPPLFFFFLL